MRIAPKPQKEMSLDELLHKPDPVEPDPLSGDGWDFWPVNTGQGQVGVRLSKELFGPKTRDELRARHTANPWNLISTDEFFGLMKYMQNGKYEAKEFIKEAMLVSDLHFATLIVWDPAGQITAAHRTNGRALSFANFEFRAATQMLFGVEYELAFLDTWNTFSPGIPDYRFSPAPGKSKITYQTIIHGNIINLVEHSSNQQGYGMLVQTREVNV